MSENRNRKLPHPAIVYLILLVLVVFISWIGSVVEIRTIGRSGGPMLQSLLSEQGIRWFVRNAASCIGNAPVGEALMILVAIGAGKESGLFRALFHSMTLSPRERVSLLISLITFVVIIAVILFGLFSGSNLLLGVTGAIKGGPLAQGAVFILMIALLLPSLIYGISTDTFHTASECVEALSSMIRVAASFLLTMLIAAQLIETVKYTRLDALAGISPGLMSVLSFLIYWIPLPIIVLLDQKRIVEV
ncbi:MAG: AbgT family transporter [Bacteroidaceae bacterium]|nr:AbgT family transporter [Bacteroidaceae bacterium]